MQHPQHDMGLSGLRSLRHFCGTPSDNDALSNVGICSGGLLATPAWALGFLLARAVRCMGHSIAERGRVLTDSLLAGACFLGLFYKLKS